MKKGNYRPSDWKWKDRGHKLRNQIALLKEQVHLHQFTGAKRQDRKRQSIRNVYRIIGAHFSELQGEPLREAVELLERQKSALEMALEQMRTSMPPIIKKKSPLTNRV